MASSGQNDGSRIIMVDTFDAVLDLVSLGQDRVQLAFEALKVLVGTGAIANVQQRNGSRMGGGKHLSKADRADGLRGHNLDRNQDAF